MRMRLFAGTLLLTSMMLTASAYAGPAEDRAAADALFREGRALVKAGKYADACPKLEASQSMDPTAGTLLALGDCYEFLGKTASAWATFNDARVMAKANKDERRESEAARRANLVEPNLSRLTIEVAPENRIAGLEVRRNGKTILGALFGSAIPVDPGEQLIEATAPGKQTWTTTVQIEAKPGATSVRIPMLEAEPVKAPPTTPAPQPVAPPPSDKPARSGDRQRTVGLVIGGVGTMVVIGGSIAGAWVLATMGEVRDNNQCTNTDPAQCTVTGHQNVQDARNAATLSNLLLLNGGLALAAGIVVFATAPKNKSPKANATSFVTPVVGPAMMGLSVQGVF
jgi:hypothetical protein